MPRRPYKIPKDIKEEDDEKIELPPSDTLDINEVRRIETKKNRQEIEIFNRNGHEVEKISVVVEFRK